MHRQLRLFATVIILIFACSDALAQFGNSNIGTEFWTGYMDHINGTTGANASQMVLYIASDVATSGTVDLADGSFSGSFSVQPNQITIFKIPSGAFLGNINGVSTKGIHIKSKNPIAVYAHIFATDISGATLLLPVNTLTNDYYSINYKQVSNTGPAYSVFMVVATEDNTVVEITPTAALIDGSPANKKISVTLQKGQVYQGLSNTDLTGTHIASVGSGSVSCKRIAVYCGSSKIYIKTPNVTSDNLIQQAYPTASWGKRFITVPLKSRNFDVLRIATSDPAAKVILNGTQLSSSQLVNGFFYELSSQSANIITSDKPIQVVQYAVTQNNGITGTSVAPDLGDPEMIFLNPLEQTIDHVTLYSAKDYLISNSYINVVIPTAAAPSFLLDGTAPSEAFTLLPGDKTYSYGQFSVETGKTHTISANAGFNATAYGFGPKESYGYAAGTNVKNLNEYIQFYNPITRKSQATGCAGDALYPEIVLPYQTSSITWDFGTGTGQVTQASPAVRDTLHRDDKVLYVYDYDKTVTYVPGTYAVKATVIDPVSISCGTNEDVSLNYAVTGAPTASFEAPDTVCLGETVKFKDASVNSGGGISTWDWNFGNGTSSNIQNPECQYLAPGDYSVSLTIVNALGCSGTYQRKIHVKNPPVAAFSISTVNCEGQPVAFTDKSTSDDGIISKWIWSYGDGSPSELKTSGALFTHTYQKAGKYTVTLQVVSSTGCSSNLLSQDVTIHALPSPDFTLPDVCLLDAYAEFTDASTISPTELGSLSYLWNFGDDNATNSNPNTSTDKNPRHKYSEAKSYAVSLTVTSANGCVAAVKTKSFTVNGAIPRAAFSVRGSGKGLCSSDDVLFDASNSSVDFGNITKIVFYFDYNNFPNESSTYYRSQGQIPADNIFRHNYGIFNAPLTKNFLVRMIVFSGESCSSIYDQTVTVQANPTIGLSSIGTICQDAGVQQITEQANGFAGTGLFSGAGISSDGAFDPAKTGPGKFTISYIFSALNGCSYATTQDVVVNPSPKVSADKNLTVLEGGQVKLNASASGDTALSYKWTMADGKKAVGLDHDDYLTPLASPQEDSRYMLTVTSAKGCASSIIVNVTVLKSPIIPNSFTPNGDGINDTWNVKYLDSYPTCTVEIYNRLGTKVFSSVGYSVPWDGTTNGQRLPVGVYYYIIDTHGRRSLFSGTITIIR